MNFLANWTFKHRKWVVIAWLLLLGGIVVAGAQIGSAYSNSFTLPKTESKVALDLLSKYAPAQQGDDIQVVYAVKKGVLTPQDIAPVEAKLSKLNHVSGIDSPFARQNGALSKDGTIGFSTLHLDVSGSNIKKSDVMLIVNTARSSWNQHPKGE
jgi:RND superfamily putative drug exporter